MFVGEVLQARKRARIALKSLVHEKQCVLPGVLGMKTHLGMVKAREGQREGLLILSLSDSQGMEQRKGVGLDIENIPAAGVVRVAL